MIGGRAERTIIRNTAVSILLLAVAAHGADLGRELLEAAKRGDIRRVTVLLEEGATPDAKDKNGRTPLMLAAQRGHAQAARLLLEKGADPEARDRQGWTAFGLVILSSNDRENMLRVLPTPQRMRIALDIQWAPDNLYSSCLMGHAQLPQHVAAMEPDALVSAAFREIASVSAKGMVEPSSEDAAEAVLHLKVRPGAACVAQQSADNLSMAVDARLERSRDHKLLHEKTYGGGLKGLHARTVNSPAQYQPLYADWAKSHANAIYWGVLEAWLRAGS